MRHLRLEVGAMLCKSCANEVQWIVTQDDGLLRSLTSLLALVRFWS